MVGHHLTIRDVSVMDGDRRILYRQFLDDFAHEEDKPSLVLESPEPTGDEVSDAMLAASVELLCNRAGIESPHWVSERRYHLDHEVWGLPELCADPARKDVRSYLRATTPEPFRKRGLMYGENVTVRI